MTTDLEALSNRIRARLPRIDALASISNYPMPDPAPALSDKDCEAVEARLGFQLPPVVRHIYRHVANGGFGPGYGLMGVGPNGFADDLKETADQRYLLDRAGDTEAPNWHWPEALLPICHFGCAVYHCVDCRTEEIIVWEPNVWGDDDPPEVGLFPTGVSLEQWVDRWARGDTVFMYRVTESGELDWQNGSLAAKQKNRSS